MEDENEVYFEYLDDLRESAMTNMFGAGPYLQSAFGLSKSEAQDILFQWMDTSEEREARKEQANE